MTFVQDAVYAVVKVMPICKVEACVSVGATDQLFNSDMQVTKISSRIQHATYFDELLHCWRSGPVTMAIASK